MGDTLNYSILGGGHKTPFLTIILEILVPPCSAVPAFDSGNENEISRDRHGNAHACNNWRISSIKLKIYENVANKGRITFNLELRYLYQSLLGRF